MNDPLFIIDENGLRLGGKWKRGLLSAIFSPIGLILLFFVVQLVLTAYIWLFFGALIGKYFIGGHGLFMLIALLVVFYGPMSSTAKLSWSLIIAAAPIFGTLTYLWVRGEVGHRLVSHRLGELAREKSETISTDLEAYSHLEAADADAASLAAYLFNTVSLPMYEGCAVRYFSLGDTVFPSMMEDIRQAEHFIFIESFIIREGYMWGQMLELLAKKAAAGVEVRVLYDGTSELGSLPRNYPQRLEALGIHCKPWLALRPFVTTAYNFRDHRKFLIVDGRLGYTGGVNLADEYINREERFGHWKDTAVRIEGRAVENFTLLFLEMWNTLEKEVEDFAPYFGHAGEKLPGQGFVLPYGDTPLDDNRTGEDVYRHVLNTAKRSVTITSPYLVLDEAMTHTLRFAAQRGVTVRLILPGIPDKKMVWLLAKTQYRSLMGAGVEIYEYTPGFLHAKSFLADEKCAVVGSINLDYRSLRHHFEDAVCLVDCPCIEDIKQDMDATLALSHRITEEDLKALKPHQKLIGQFMRLLAPML